MNEYEYSLDMKNMNLAKPFAPWIYSKNAEQGRPFTAVILLCFGNTICWVLAGSLASPDKHRAAGAAQSSISNATDLQLILWGWFQGKGGKGQPQCQTPNLLTFFIWVKLWVCKFRSTLWRLCCYWIIHLFLSHTDFLNASFHCGINRKQWKVD